MSNWHGNGETPRLGSKIQYGVNARKFETAVYGEYSQMSFDIDELLKSLRIKTEGDVGLSDFQPWKWVRMWKYLDEFYDYGRGLDKRSKG